MSDKHKKPSEHVPADKKDEFINKISDAIVRSVDKETAKKIFDLAGSK